MNKTKGKNAQSNSNVESESDESNQYMPNLDLSLMRQPIATSITSIEEVLRAYEAGTNEVSIAISIPAPRTNYRLFFPHSCENYFLKNAT